METRGDPRPIVRCVFGSILGFCACGRGVETPEAGIRSILFRRHRFFSGLPHGRRRVHGLWTLFGVPRYRRPLHPSGKGGRRGLVRDVLRERLAGGSRLEMLESLRIDPPEFFSASATLFSGRKTVATFGDLDF